MSDAYDSVIADLTKRREELDITIKLLRVFKAVRGPVANAMASIPLPDRISESMSAGDGSL